MASIGPQLPPHLAKRKRTPDDEGRSESPPPKLPRSARNGEEIALDSSSSSSSDDDESDGVGPTAAPPLSRPAALTASRPSIGPTLPPQVTAANAEEIDLDDDEDEEKENAGPAPPPRPISRSIGPPIPSTSADIILRPPTPPPEKRMRVLGPAPPPAPLSTRPLYESHPPFTTATTTTTTTRIAASAAQTVESDSGSGSDDDDDYGPALPSSNPHRPPPTAGPAMPRAREEDEEPATKRDDWMLAPPPGGELGGGFGGGGGGRAPDPTQLRARKFATGRAAVAAGVNKGGISSIWTETPEQKAKRLADAVLGRSSGGGGVAAAQARGSGAAGRHASRPTVAPRDDAIRSFTEQTRGKSLYEEHQAAKRAKAAGTAAAATTTGPDGEVEDDPSKRAFDREKDMALGGRINATQRRELLNRAASFGDRFQKGRYL